MSQMQVNGWRGPAIVASLVAATAHIPVTGDHFGEAPYIGALFVVLEVVATALALWLLWRDDRAAYGLTALTGVLAIAAYVLSRSVALPQIADDVGNWAEPLGVVSLVAETLMVVAGMCGALARTRRFLPARVAAQASAVLLVIGLGVTVIASAAEPKPSDAGPGMSMTG
ncbi:MAG: hypothetical protein ACTHK4_05095 [Mycobacteriales bacterium]